MTEELAFRVYQERIPNCASGKAANSSSYLQNSTTMELHSPRFSDFSIHSLMTARSFAELGDPPGPGWPPHAMHPGLHDGWAIPHHGYMRTNPNMMDGWGQRQTAIGPLQPHLQEHHQHQLLPPHSAHMQYSHPFNTPVKRASSPVAMMPRPPSLESGYDSFNSPHLPSGTPAARTNPHLSQAFMGFSPVTPLENGGPNAAGGFRQEWVAAEPEVIAGDLPEQDPQGPESCAQDLVQCPQGQTEDKTSLDEVQEPEPKRRRVDDAAAIPCAVCGDKASGVHYHVHACEGCKGFFKRVTSRNTRLVCPRNYQCEVTRESRTRCQACRFQGCLRAGMTKDVNTISKRGKKRPLVPQEQASAVSQPSDDLIHALTTAHHATFSPACHIQHLSEASLWAAEVDVGVEGRNRAQQFALMVPGIANLPPADQQAVLNQAVPEVMILRLASRFVPEHKGFAVPGGLLVPLAAVVTALGRSLAQKLVRLATFLLYMSIDDTELSLLCGIVTTLPDRLSDDSEALEELEKQHDAHLRALQEYELDKRRSKPNALAKILLRLLDVRAIAMREAGRLILSSRPQQVPSVDLPVESTGFNSGMTEFVPEEHTHEPVYLDGHPAHNTQASYINPKLEAGPMYHHSMNFEHQQQHHQARLQHPLHPQQQQQQPPSRQLLHHQQEQHQHHQHQQQLYYQNVQQGRQQQHQVILEREGQERIMKVVHERQHGLHMLPGRHGHVMQQETQQQSTLDKSQEEPQIEEIHDDSEG